MQQLDEVVGGGWLVVACTQQTAHIHCRYLAAMIPQTAQEVSTCI
jgi:hypothetical protein